MANNDEEPVGSFVDRNHDVIMGEQVYGSRPGLDPIMSLRGDRKCLPLIFMFASLNKSFVEETTEEVSPRADFDA